jgi:hypothetical protein
LDPDSAQFTNAQANNDAGVTRRLVGVQAARVEALDGTVTLQTSNNVATRLLVVVQEAAGNVPGSMTFGPDDGNGGISTPLLQVNDQGDLSVSGKFQSGSSLAPGTVSVQSGLATDGVVLPLPTGVTEDEVTAGTILLHIQVVPVITNISLSTASPTNFAAVPQSCYVDAQRRVHCVIRTLSFNGTLISATDTPGTCRYTLIAASAGTGGSSS